jgi:hypothetical protein
MKFTIVFPHEFAICMKFEPCLVWALNGKKLWVPHPSNPHYLPGDFVDLVAKLRSMNSIKFSDENLTPGGEIYIIAHPEGIGTEDNLNALVDDVKACGLIVKICR